jgi:polyferredoxin
MVFDFLPWKRPAAPRRRLGWLRYVHLGVVAGTVAGLFFVAGVRQPLGSDFGIAAFMVGTAAYWIAGIALAAAFKDNRAFCKYLCPIAPLMKPVARLALLKQAVDASKCKGCRACERACPMDVKLLAARDAGTRVLDTECIQCGTCSTVCRPKAVRVGFRLPGPRS